MSLASSASYLEAVTDCVIMSCFSFESTLGKLLDDETFSGPRRYNGWERKYSHPRIEKASFVAKHNKVAAIVQASNYPELLAAMSGCEMEITYSAENLPSEKATWPIISTVSDKGKFTIGDKNNWSQEIPFWIQEQVRARADSHTKDIRRRGDATPKSQKRRSRETERQLDEDITIHLDGQLCPLIKRHEDIVYSLYFLKDQK